MEIAPELRKTQVNGLVYLIVGIYLSKSVNLGIIAGKITGLVRRLSNVKRLSRLLKNQNIDVEKIYHPIAQEWMRAQAAASQQVKLIIDGTKIGFGHQLLMVSMAYRKRSIPICWTWVKYVKGHSTTEKQIEVLQKVHELLPPGVAVILVGDSEFGAIELIRCLDEWRWDYVLREKGRLSICLKNETGWKKLSEISIQPGQKIWIEQCYLTQKEIYPVSILIYWKKGEDSPWYLATSLPDQKMTISAYSRRMWIEEMFGDMKRNGFDFERTMLRDMDRLSRLTLAISLLYVWLISIGSRSIKNGDRVWVDRNDRRDLSIFQIGFRFMERKLVNSLPFSIPLCLFY
jgi:hypothetical protein